MRDFELSLPIRLALAALSGLLTWPAFLLSDVLDELWIFPGLDWWMILHGLLFAMLVMIPFLSSGAYLKLKITAMALASIVAYYAAIHLPGLLGIETNYEMIAFAESGVIGAVLVAIAVKFLAALKTGARFWSLIVLAGAIGGAVFSLTIDICVMDSCNSLIEILGYTFGWIAWQVLVCAALWFGRSPSAP